MSAFIDECHEGSIGIETIIRSLVYTDPLKSNFYINFLDSGLSEDEVTPISDCADARSVEQLFRLTLVEDLAGNPAIHIVFISEGSPCIDDCQFIGIETLFYQCFYTDAEGNIYLGIKEDCSLFLNEFPGAVGASSVRLLDCDYEDNCLRVVRHSDDDELDIGFVNRVLDTTSLTNFVGASTGSVKRFYDQTGNGNNLVQLTRADQPIIVNAGTLITVNGQPALDFDGGTQCMDADSLAATFAGSDKLLHAYSVFKPDVVNITQELCAFGSDASGTPRHQLDFVSALVRLFRRDDASASVSPTGGALTAAQHLRSHIFSGTILNEYLDGVNVINDAAANVGACTFDNFRVGCVKAGALTVQHYNGKLQELIMYADDQSAVRVNQQDNINQFFNIY